MALNYTFLELENKKKHNTIVFKKSYTALRRGILSIYFREDIEKDSILKLYDEHIFTYIDYIYDIIIAKVKNICKDYSKNIMFNNLLILILLFFIIDYRHVENYQLEKIDEFFEIIVNEGLKYNNGNGYFQLNLNIVIQMIHLDLQNFQNLLLLKNPNVSIFYNKKNTVDLNSHNLSGSESPLLGESVFFEKENNILSNIQQNTCLPTPIHINHVNQTTKEEPVLNSKVVEENIIATQMNILSLEILRLRELLGKSMEQNSFLTGLNTVLIQQKEILIQEVENVKIKNSQLLIENDMLKRERESSFENDFTKSLTYSIFN